MLNPRNFRLGQSFEIRRKQSSLQGDDQLTIRYIASLEHPVLPKTNLTKQCKVYQRLLRHSRSVPYVLVDASVLEKCIHNAAPVATTKLQ